ncbi:MAG: segregation/condensation protein A, partial [Clostridia bacterium]|nr:segregation/condensation protein A [Clostridia bacterium]
YMATADEEVITTVQDADGDANSVTPENSSEGSVLPSNESTDVSSDDLNLGFLVEKPKIVYKLSDYEGPIELLYELIKAAKIPIEDIFISDITSQYVQIIKDTPKEELDYDYAGDFISMAAELIYLKSVRTLPKDDEEDGGENGEDEHQQLINKIKQYALIREKSEKLRDIETINRFYRPPTYTDKDYRVALVNFSLPKLVEAFAKVLANADKHEREIIPKKVMKDRFSVHEQMQHISMLIAVRGEMKFTDIFEPDYDKSDIVTTFLAVLELLKYGRLRAVQEEVFGEIMIYAVEGTDNLPIEFEEDDDGKY